jgi:hypothetical protein
LGRKGDVRPKVLERAAQKVALSRRRVFAMLLADIRQIPGRFDVRIALLTGLGNGKSPSPRAKGHRS